MRRLKSILTPPATAGRRTRFVSAAAGASLIGLAGLASVAVASQREMSTVVADPGGQEADWPSRYLQASARDGQLFCAAPDGNRDRTFGCDAVLWSAAERETRQSTGAFCTPATADVAGLETIAERARPFILTATDTSGSSQDAARRALIAAFPCQGEAQQPTTAQIAAVETSLNAEWTAQHAARSAVESAAYAARMRAQTPADIKRECVAGNRAEPGCDGLIFGFVIAENQKPATDRTFCAPEAVEDGPEMASRVKSAIARASVQGQEDRRAFLTRVLTEAYPCSGPRAASRATALAASDFAVEASTVSQARKNLPPPREGTTRLMIRMDYGDEPMVLATNDRLRVSLEGSNDEGVRSSTEAAFDLKPGVVLPNLVWLDISDHFFPKGGDNAAYTLTARIERGDDGPARFAAEPSTIRLAPMSQSRLARMRPELTLRPVTTP